ncbi:MAG: hypothetical protein K0M60_14355 [Hydrogenophaga sp.]|nr:hypothetical protein [Hydrogenophaga sp.]MBW8319742.1 hypothetical protein [Rhizobium sp.]
MVGLIKQFWKAIGVAFFLLGIFWLPKDLEDYPQAAEPWLRFIAMVDQNTALWFFSSCLAAWIGLTDVRRFIAKKRQEKLSRPKPETESDIFLRERIIEFGQRYYVPATDALNEALRISSYVVKDAWDHPAKLFVFSAFSNDITYNPVYRRIFGGMEDKSNLRRRDLERMMISALNEYGIRSHKLQHVVSLLASENKPLSLHQFDKKLAEFWSSRQDLIQVLRDIQSLPGLSELRSYNIETYIDDRNKWDMSVIQRALN